MDFETVFRNSDKPNWVEYIKEYIEAGGDIDRRHLISGWTLLHLAAEIQHYEAMSLLIERGASPNIQNADGWTPLHIAVDSETQAKVQMGIEINLETIQMLLDAGADPTIPDKYGGTPFSLARAMDDTLATLLRNSLEESQDTDQGDQPQIT